MASSFWSGDFYFDNTHSGVYKVCIIDFNSNDIVKQIGGSYVISTEKDTSYNNQHFYIEKERTSDDIVIQLVKTDRKAWTIAEILDINGWLFKENFCKFQPTDFSNQGYNIVYYLKAMDMKKYLTPDLEGYLEITFQSYDGYAYIIPNKQIILTSNETKTINNMSNVNKKYLPKIKIVGTGSITISNRTNGDSLSLNGNGETIIIDCAIGSVTNSSNLNRFSLLKNYDFLGLEKGNNTIQIIGNATVEFICEFPIIM